MFLPHAFGETLYIKVLLRSECIIISIHEQVDVKKTPNRSSRSGLSSDACPICGTPMKEKRGKLAFPVNGEDIRVPGTTHLACPKGHDPILRADEARWLREHALDLYRKKYGLLTAEDIRSLRERFGLTQAELARLLRLGPNTLSRWEAGRKVQTAAMDILLRVLRDVPGGLDYLREHAA